MPLHSPNTPAVSLFFGGTDPVLIGFALLLWLFQVVALKITSFLFLPFANSLRNGPLTWFCLFVETPISSVMRDERWDFSSASLLPPHILNSTEYNFAESVLSSLGGAVGSGRQDNMQTYPERSHVAIDVDSDGESSAEESFEHGMEHAIRILGRERPEPSVRGATDQLRSEFTRLRNTIDQNEEAQNICTIFTALLPFVTLFVLKVVLDNFGDIAKLLFGYVFFLGFDARVQEHVAAARSSFFGKITLFLAMVGIIYLCSSFIFAVDDFDLFNVLLFKPAGDSYHGFSFTVLCILLADNFVKIVTCCIKFMIQLLPFKMFSPHYKRRLFQCCEYVSQTYRCCLPSYQWILYFYGEDENSMRTYDVALIGVYAALKIRELYFLSKTLLDSFKNIFQASTFGTTPDKRELENAQMCAICHDDYSSPTKLPCEHIFCVDCIDTWLDKETTCPMCRKTVELKNNLWKSGATSKLIRFY